MSDKTTDITIPWYQSRTVWASIVTGLINAATSAGYHIDPFWSQSLPDILLNIASLAGIGATIYCHLRSKHLQSQPIKETL